jgi:pilus assembly protein FimV
MVAKRSSRAVALLLVVPSAAFALGLGDIRLLSPLDQPLKAQIELLDASPDALQNLQVHIASRDTFARYGLGWPQFLGGVHLKTVRTADGREVVELTSDEPITDPVLTLLVEANWDRGHLIREYTVLLDPPTYVPPQSQVAREPVAPAATGTAQLGGAIQRSQSAPSESPAPQPAAAPASSEASASATATPSGEAAPHSLIVRRGQTLSGIAHRLSGAGLESAPTHAWMVALYRSNPGAFDHNMNLLRSGAVLRVPDDAAVAAISPAAAAAEIHRQYAAWRSSAPQSANSESGPGRLRLVAPPAGAAASGSPSSAGSGAGDVKALQAQVQTLQSQLADEHRLLQLKDAQLASMQAQLAGKGTAQSAPTESPPATAPAATAQANPPAANAVPSAATSPTQTPPQAAVPPPAPVPAPSIAAPATHAPPIAHHAPVPVKAAPKPSGSIIATLARYWWAIALLLVALLGYLAAKTLRSRRQSDLDESLGRLAAAGGPSPYTRVEPTTHDTVPMRGLAPEQDDSFVVEESGTHERPRIAAAAPPVAKLVTSADQTISSETALNLEQGDPLAEADFHMAYGLYDQAADLIRIAIEREPERRDLKLKLLEVFFVWGNKEQFLHTARELAETRTAAAPGEWEKILIMGKQLAPEDPLFAGGAAVSGAASAGVDLDLAGGQAGGDTLDFDVATGRTQQSQALDLDIGSALGEGEGLGGSPGATDRNLALTDSHFAENATTGSTREMTASTREMAAATREMTREITREMTATLPGRDEPTGEFGTVIEGPTIEQPALQMAEHPTIKRKVESALRQSGGEQTAELAIDDLGLDLGAFESDPPGTEGVGESSPETPTLVAGLDEHSRKVMEQASQRATGPVEPTGTTNAWQIDESELEAVLSEGGERANGHDAGAATSRLGALDAGSVDYELAAEQSESEHTANGAGIDLDVGTATVPDAAFTATQKLSADDLALPDLEPVTLSEVGTKLDLARAYMDMGDPEGARNILEEVMHEGSAAQRQEAERLMESLPG